MKNSASLLLLLLLVAISACKEKEEETPTPTNSTLLKEKTELLTAKPWKIVSVKQNGNDVFKDYAECLKDDLYIYQIDGNYKVDEGTIKCSPNGSQIRTTSTWEFTDNETKLIFHDGAVVEIMTLTSTQFTIITPPQKNIITYTNQ